MHFKDKEVFILGPGDVNCPNRTLKKMGVRCEMTDFAVLLGGGADFRTRAGWYANYGYGEYGDVYVTDSDGRGTYREADERTGGVRPVIYFDDLTEVLKNAKSNSYGILETVYGEYPQFVVPWRFAPNSGFVATGKKYVTDSRLWNKTSEPFKAREYEEYIIYDDMNIYKGVKYIQFVYHDTMSCLLSNGKFYKPGDSVMIKVDPVLWYVDEEENRLISKYLLASGIRFCDRGDYEGNFYDTEMYKFLSEDFVYDIVPSIPPKDTLSLKRIQKI